VKLQYVHELDIDERYAEIETVVSDILRCALCRLLFERGGTCVRTRSKEGNFVLLLHLSHLPVADLHAGGGEMGNYPY